MKTLHFYLIRQVLATLLMTVAVFTFVLLLGNVLKEVLALLVGGQVTLGLVAQVILLLIPFVLVYALPMGLLTATLLVFGRFSADQELIAMRASGVSLVSLVAPVLVVSLLLSGVCAVINLQVAPHCRLAYKSLLKEASAKKFASLLPEETFIRDFPGHIVYLGKVDGTNLGNIWIYELNPEGAFESYVRASSGTLVMDYTNSSFSVQLMDAWRVALVQGEWTAMYSGELPLEDIRLEGEPGKRISLSDMSIRELFDELRDLEGRVSVALPLEIAVDPGMKEKDKGRKGRRQKQNPIYEVKLQIHRQVSFSFACVGFALVGIPLGIRAHRRETTFGIMIALLLVLVYYSFFIIGQSLENRPEWGPHLILWLPNFIFQTVGVVLLWRANRGI